MRSAPALVVSLLFLACAPEDPVGGAPGPGAPGGPCRQDGSCEEGLRCEDERCVYFADGGPPDAGADSGPVDAGEGDAGGPDAGAPDAGDVDAGAPDAGAPDAGAPDAGAPDAGAPDAGAPDAGDVDAGAPDAGLETPCAHNADCPGGQRCTLVEADGGLVALCAPPAGSGAPGAACGASGDCAAGLCLDGFCSALCESPADCGGGQVCREETVTVGGASGAFDLCLTLPEQACVDNDVCAADGRVCGDIDFDTEPLTAYCALPVEDGAIFGEQCAGFTSLNDQCEDRLCLYDRCTRMCTDDGDCAGAAGGFGCTDISFTSGGVLRMCVDTCAKDSDCAVADHACVISRDETDDEFHWVCREPTRPDPPGSACAGQNNCDHGACITIRDQPGGTVIDSYCTLPCEVSADCPVELPVCEDASFRLPSGNGSQVLRVCGRD